MSDHTHCSRCGASIISEYRLADPDTARVWCGFDCYVRAFDHGGPRAGALLSMRVLLELDERVRAGVAWLEMPGGRYKLYKLVADWAAFQSHLLRCELHDVDHPEVPRATREDLNVMRRQTAPEDDANPAGDSSDDFWRVGR